jgi:hypothetical protein
LRELPQRADAAWRPIYEWLPPVAAITTSVGLAAGDGLEATDAAAHPITVATSNVNSTFSVIRL